MGGYKDWGDTMERERDEKLSGGGLNGGKLVGRR